jgi:hypothetical protein
MFDALERQSKWSLDDPQSILDYGYSRMLINENGCWVFQGSKNPAGYGHVTRRNKQYEMHRLMAYASCLDAAGNPLWDIGDTRIVPHHDCGNKSCIRPGHLIILNRSVHILYHQALCQSNYGSASLTGEQVRFIKTRLSNGDTVKVIAAEYQVSKNTIYRIKSGEHYQWVR